MNDPDNYRGITGLSCFGKLFTSVTNDRIHSFLETNDILGNEQSGFRKGHSMMDHVFALHCLIDVYLQRKKRSHFVRLLAIKRPLIVSARIVVEKTVKFWCEWEGSTCDTRYVC